MGVLVSIKKNTLSIEKSSNIRFMEEKKQKNSQENDMVR